MFLVSEKNERRKKNLVNFFYVFDQHEKTCDDDLDQ